jgi:histidine triad (HIT) family protein
VSSDCIFCKIASGALGTEFVYEDDACVAFRDIDPKAPTHALLVTREHIASLGGATADEAERVAHLLAVAPVLARQLGLAGGFRVVMNSGPDGGQAVDHVHLHLLGGRQMHWPPG